MKKEYNDHCASEAAECILLEKFVALMVLDPEKVGITMFDLLRNDPRATFKEGLASAVFLLERRGLK